MQDKIYKFIPYDKRAQERARELRRDQTQPEKLLWEKLRGRRFHGLKFLRQKPIHDFIMDFYCAELKLAIEVDGNIHDQERDAERDYILKQKFGIKVVRFRNDEVLKNLDEVKTHLASLIKEEGVK